MIKFCFNFYKAKIIVSKKESQSQWQQNDYKVFSPNIDWDNVDFSKAPAIQEMPVISAICKPEQSEIIKVINGKINVKGKIIFKISLFYDSKIFIIRL